MPDTHKHCLLAVVPDYPEVQEHTRILKNHDGGNRYHDYRKYKNRDQPSFKEPCRTVPDATALYV